ncbi:MULTISPECIES: RpnC/YadD family protein [Photorhabdus]|uniref:Transposase n=1 Tax=Photorhabdus asymbiotica subsp. asymbiotica (strain ATCC 43949 / 3105-77) TaxID=553480 RepID=B6VLA9_PHOAA|nr:hypothetical protein [Photorhabdus asymbiotica]CAQ85883.1 Putative Transposase [Photorhabdus asymbiotica]CAR66939.1 Putative Transposase [Photorhabdus asymbiotica subsp. asymbiotica ATCC 43949]
MRDEFTQVIPLLAQALNNHYNSDNDIITILNYLFLALDSPYFEQIVQQLSEQTEKHQEAIVNIAQRLQEKGEKLGWERGRQEGIEQGIEQEKLRSHQRQLETARTLLKNRVSLDLIMESTGLSRDELISLQ